MSKHSSTSSRGVEHPIQSDAALSGDTRAELATKVLPRRSGPHGDVVTHQGLNSSDPGRGDANGTLLHLPVGKGEVRDGQKYAFRSSKTGDAGC